MKKIKMYPLLFASLFIFFIGGSFFGYWKGNDFLSYFQSIFSEKQESIFISIASYRDKNCPRTLEEIYNKADHPERIFVGIYQQNGPYDISCQTPNIDPKLQKNISLVTVPAKEARGPAFARYHASLLFKDEDFFLEIDAHMRLVPHWDTLLLNMWHKLADEKGSKVILTTCPLNWDVANDTVDPAFETHLPLSCGMDFSHENELPRIASLVYEKTSSFHESPFVAGGFFFAPGKFLESVPYDPNLSYLVWGEEALLSIRLWCKGYRFYNPDENLIFHYYERVNEPKIWDDDPNYYEINAKTSELVKTLIGLVPGKEDTTYPYGVDLQCAKEFYKTYKIDPVHHTSVNLCDPEGRLIETSSEDTSSKENDL